MASMEPLNRMVRMVGRAFYDDISMDGEHQPKSARCDYRGIGVVVLDALTRRQWVREEYLAKALKIHSRQLRRILKFFEEEKLVYDVVRYRINRMRKKLKDELDDRDTIQHYICPNCKRSEEFAPDNAKKHSHDKLKDMQKRMEEQLKTLIELLDRIKDISFPNFGSLQHWERATIKTSTNDAFGSSLNSGTPMPFLGGLEIEVKNLGSASAQEGVESGMQSIKPLPLWMNCTGTYLMKEQKEENNHTANLDQSSEAKSDQKQLLIGDEKNGIQEAYAKAYYEAIQRRQEERRIQEENMSCISNHPFISDLERQLGAKSKRDDSVESDDDRIELEVKQPTGTS
uniref:HTH TFE/IIEalpha-type domain-containing protein n=1 Tax=Leersia perrieri TaxID=77586 RepID=A0A0D9XNV1_9ORYZ